MDSITIDLTDSLNDFMDENHVKHRNNFYTRNKFFSNRKLKSSNTANGLAQMATLTKQQKPHLPPKNLIITNEAIEISDEEIDNSSTDKDTVKVFDINDNDSNSECDSEDYMYASLELLEETVNSCTSNKDCMTDTSDCNCSNDDLSKTAKKTRKIKDNGPKQINSTSSSPMSSATRNLLANIADRPIQFPESFSSDFGFVISNVEGAVDLDELSDEFEEICEDDPMAKDKTIKETENSTNEKVEIEKCIDKTSIKNKESSETIDVDTEDTAAAENNEDKVKQQTKDTQVENTEKEKGIIYEKEVSTKKIDDRFQSTNDTESKLVDNTDEDSSITKTVQKEKSMESMDACSSNQEKSIEMNNKSSNSNESYSPFAIRTPDQGINRRGPSNRDTSIRNILKLQLSTLRTKKNMRGNLKLETKVVENEFESEKVLDKNNTIKEVKSIAKITDSNSVLCENVPSKSTYEYDEYKTSGSNNVIEEIRKIISKSKVSSGKSSRVSNVNEKETEKLNDTVTDIHKAKDSTADKQLTRKEKIENKFASLDSTHTISDCDTRSNSPFISNTLDDFLVNAKLNVSYSIPKLYAEEGIKNSCIGEYAQKMSPKVISRKTKADAGERKVAVEAIAIKPKKEHVPEYKAKTLAEKRRLLERSKQRENRRIINHNKLENTQKRSYVLFQNRKVYIKTRSTLAKCIASIDSTLEDENVSKKYRKPSMLTEMFKKEVKPVKYKAGPLSKKPILQYDRSSWMTEIKKLPQIQLNVVPELGKRIDPAVIHFLPKWNDKITEYQADFALSVIVNRNQKEKDEKKVFTFNVPYENNQKQIAVRKRRLESEDFISSSKKDACLTPEEQVADVIEKLINYVEIKELSSTLIKEDPDTNNTESELLEKSETKDTSNHVLVKRRGFKRRSKIDLELSRLNCKVVSVEFEETQIETNCTKAHCALGCVCNSLKCEAIIELHCQNANCIFGCVCSKDNSKYINIPKPTIKFPAGTDLLSTDTVTRIEDQAKRNLAKVEKEFTQTVIHTNDKTIVIGFGNKTRRAVKTPKKYNDFLEDDDEERQSSTNSDAANLVIPCAPYAENFDFSDIIPFCLVHSLYDCHCGGHSTLLDENGPQKKKPKIDKPMKIDRTAEDNSNSEVGEVLYSSSGRLIRRKIPSYVMPSNDSLVKNNKVEEENDSACCSRTVQLPEKYLDRKRKTKNRQIKEFADTVSIDEMSPLNGFSDPDQLNDSDRYKMILLSNISGSERDNCLADDSETKKNKRKQQLQCRNEEPVQVWKINKKFKKIQPIFEDEIIITDSEWIKKLGFNSKYPLEGYARILPGNALLRGFITKTINVFCVLDIPLKIIINIGEKICSAKVRDVERNGQEILDAPNTCTSPSLIQQSDNIRKIIKWLLSGTLPARFQKHNLAFLLLETSPNVFEIRGICSPGEANNKLCMVDVDANKNDDIEQGIVDQVLEVKHKNAENIIETLFGIKAKFNLRELTDKNDKDLADSLYMWVSLPDIYQVARWRVIFIHERFDFLMLNNINYTIRRSDLVKLARIAKQQKHSLILRNLRIIRSNKHKLFGIYISYTHLDRVFIGPYFTNDPIEDVSVLKQGKSVLYDIDTPKNQSSNGDCKCGNWLYERSKNVKKSVKKVINRDTIDLTLDDDDDDNDVENLNTTITTSNKTYLKAKRRRLSQNQESNSDAAMSSSTTTADGDTLSKNNKVYQIIMHQGHKIQIKSSAPKTPSDFNRFILTNIPHFGYLGASQEEKSSALEVSWPFEKKVLIFENTENAIDFLQKRLSQLLQPVPETFRIRVVVLKSLDLNEHKPINYNRLNGYCICGYFGSYNIKEITDEFCREKFNMSKASIILLFAKRSQSYIRNRMEDLVDLLGMDKNNEKGYENVIRKAIEEIRQLEAVNHNSKESIQKIYKDILDNLKTLSTHLPTKNERANTYVLNQIKLVKQKIRVLMINDEDKLDFHVRKPSPSIATNLAKLLNLPNTKTQSVAASATSKTDNHNITNHKATKSTATVATKKAPSTDTASEKIEKPRSPIKKLKFIRSPNGELLLVKEKKTER